MKSPRHPGPDCGCPACNGYDFEFSPARVAALKSIKAWDDPELRRRYADAYRKYDAEHRGIRQAVAADFGFADNTLE